MARCVYQLHQAQRLLCPRNCDHSITPLVHSHLVYHCFNLPVVHNSSFNTWAQKSIRGMLTSSSLINHSSSQVRRLAILILKLSGLMAGHSDTEAPRSDGWPFWYWSSQVKRLAILILKLPGQTAGHCDTEAPRSKGWPFRYWSSQVGRLAILILKLPGQMASHFDTEAPRSDG